MCSDWLKIVFVSLDGDTELACAVDVTMAQAKRIYILIIKVHKLFSYFLVVVFSKRNRKYVTLFGKTRLNENSVVAFFRWNAFSTR